jgi:excisionase family DNA binding protein
MSSTGEVSVPRLLTPKQVAAVTGLQVFRVRQLIREGRLPVIRVGRTFRISETVLAEFIQRESQSRGGR